MGKNIPEFVLTNVKNVLWTRCVFDRESRRALMDERPPAGFRSELRLVDEVQKGAYSFRSGIWLFFLLFLLGFRLHECLRCVDSD